MYETNCTFTVGQPVHSLSSCDYQSITVLWMYMQRGDIKSVCWYLCRVFQLNHNSATSNCQIARYHFLPAVSIKKTRTHYGHYGHVQPLRHIVGFAIWLYDQSIWTRILLGINVDPESSVWHNKPMLLQRS